MLPRNFYFWGSALYLSHINNNISTHLVACQILISMFTLAILLWSSFIFVLLMKKFTARQTKCQCSSQSQDEKLTWQSSGVLCSSRPDWLGLCIIPPAPGLPQQVTCDTSIAGAKAETERGPEELFCPSSPVKPSHTSPLGACYIKCIESPGIQVTLQSNESTHLESPTENLAEPGAPLTCPPLLLPEPAMLVHSVSRRHRDTRPLKSCQAL